MDIGQVIRNLREAQSLSAEQLALGLGVETSTITRAERGERRLSTDLLEGIAKALDTDVTSLYAVVEGRELLPGSNQSADHADVEATVSKVRKLLSGLTPKQRELVVDLAQAVSRNSAGDSSAR